MNRHGAEVTLPVPPHIYEQDPELWSGLATPLGEFLLLERALCSCEGRCECDD
jgi:hypothetical protein